MSASNEREIQERHERLCAYVLGELEGPERETVERELAESAELRAERERLEATIGLVQRSLGDAPEALSDAAAGRVLAAAGAATIESTSRGSLRRAQRAGPR